MCINCWIGSIIPGLLPGDTDENRSSVPPVFSEKATKYIQPEPPAETVKTEVPCQSGYAAITIPSSSKSLEVSVENRHLF